MPWTQSLEQPTQVAHGARDMVQHCRRRSGAQALPWGDFSVAEFERICPLCDVDTDDQLCTACNVPTIHRSVFEVQPAPVCHGALIADRYKIEEVIGRGGQATVYRAVQVGMNRVVAIKTLDAELSGRPKQVKRFYLEAQAASSLDHPNVVQIFDFGIDTNTRLPFYVMEYLDGGTLSEVLTRDGPMPEQRATHLVSQIARALVAAHDAMIVHRDLKPQNITVQVLPDGEELIKVLDFGIAKLLLEDGDHGLTSTGDTLGTPLYMSPEQVRGGEITFQTDLYALGCVLYQCMTGVPPFQARDAYGLVVRHLRHEPPALPQALADGKPPSETVRLLYRRLLEKAPSNRPKSTAAVASMLRQLSHGNPPESPPDWLSTSPALAETDGSSQLQFFPAEEGADKADTQADPVEQLGITPQTVLARPKPRVTKARDLSTPPPLPNDAEEAGPISPELVATREGPATDLDRQANKIHIPRTKIWWAAAALLLIGSAILLWRIMDDHTSRNSRLRPSAVSQAPSHPSPMATKSRSERQSKNQPLGAVVDRRSKNTAKPGATEATPTEDAKRPLHTDPKRDAETPLKSKAEPENTAGKAEGSAPAPPSVKTKRVDRYVWMKTIPKGALVYQDEVQDGEEIGVTPYHVPPAVLNTSQRFIVIRKGYKNLIITPNELHPPRKPFKLEIIPPPKRRRLPKRKRIEAWDDKD
jgi:serine/threonine protein kinase